MNEEGAGLRPEDDLTTLTAAELAERVALMVGWTAADHSERGKAKTELWQAWARAYEAEGGSLDPRKHPELSDARIADLARRRDAKVAATTARLRGEASATSVAASSPSTSTSSTSGDRP